MLMLLQAAEGESDLEEMIVPATSSAISREVGHGFLSFTDLVITGMIIVECILLQLFPVATVFLNAYWLSWLYIFLIFIMYFRLFLHM